MYAYEKFYFLGIHALWWIALFGVFCWLFRAPYRVFLRQNKHDVPLEIQRGRVNTDEVGKGK